MTDYTDIIQTTAKRLHVKLTPDYIQELWVAVLEAVDADPQADAEAIIQQRLKRLRNTAIREKITVIRENRTSAQGNTVSLFERQSVVEKAREQQYETADVDWDNLRGQLASIKLDPRTRHNLQRMAMGENRELSSNQRYWAKLRAKAQIGDLHAQAIIEHIYANRKTPEGRAMCKRAARQYYLSHKDKVNALIKAWRAQNKDKVHAGYVRHRERRIAEARAWLAAHPDKVREYTRRYNASHPETVQAQRARAVVWYHSIAAVCGCPLRQATYARRCPLVRKVQEQCSAWMQETADLFQPQRGSRTLSIYGRQINNIPRCYREQETLP